MVSYETQQCSCTQKDGKVYYARLPKDADGLYVIAGNKGTITAMLYAKPDKTMMYCLSLLGDPRNSATI